MVVLLRSLNHSNAPLCRRLSRVKSHLLFNLILRVCLWWPARCCCSLLLHAAQCNQQVNVRHFAAAPTKNWLYSVSFSTLTASWACCLLVSRALLPLDLAACTGVEWSKKTGGGGWLLAWGLLEPQRQTRTQYACADCTDRDVHSRPLVVVVPNIRPCLWLHCMYVNDVSPFPHWAEFSRPPYYVPVSNLPVEANTS